MAEQAIVICPLIGLQLPKNKSTARDDEDDDAPIEYAAIEWGLEHDAIGDTLSAATKHAEILRSQVAPQASVALLHGKMGTSRKERGDESVPRWGYRCVGVHYRCRSWR